MKNLDKTGDFISENLNEDMDLPIRDNVMDFSSQLLNQIEKYKNSVGPGEKLMDYTKTIDAIKNLMKAVNMDEKDETSYGDAFRANLKKRRKSEEEERRKLGFLEEGSCGYGEDGKVGTKPAGSHLLKIKEMIKNKIKDMNEDVVKGSNIKKVGDSWRVVSGKTGKLWPQTYDSKAKAEDALQAYHAQNESLVETIFAKLNK
jgi:hypothetical protein